MREADFTLQQPAAIASSLASFPLLLSLHLAPAIRVQYATSLGHFLQWCGANPTPSGPSNCLLHLSCPPPGTARSVLTALAFASNVFLPSRIIPYLCWSAVTAVTRLAPPQHHMVPHRCAVRRLLPIHVPHCRPRQHRWCLQTHLHPSLQSLPHFGPAILSHLHLMDPQARLNVSSVDAASASHPAKPLARSRATRHRQRT